MIGAVAIYLALTSALAFFAWGAFDFFSRNGGAE